MARLRVNEAGS